MFNFLEVGESVANRLSNYSTISGGRLLICCLQIVIAHLQKVAASATVTACLHSTTVSEMDHVSSTFFTPIGSHHCFSFAQSFWCVSGHTHIAKPLVAVAQVTINLKLSMILIYFWLLVALNHCTCKRSIRLWYCHLNTHTDPLSTENVSWVGNSCTSIRPAIVCVLTALEDVIYIYNLIKVWFMEYGLWSPFSKLPPRYHITPLRNTHKHLSFCLST